MPFTPRSSTWRPAGGLGFVIKVTLQRLCFQFPVMSAVRRWAVKQPSCTQREKSQPPRVEGQKEEKSPRQWWHNRATLGKIIPSMPEPLLSHFCYTQLKACLTWQVHKHRQRERQGHEDVGWKGNCADHGEGFAFSQTVKWGVQTNHTPNVRKAEVLVYIFAARPARDFTANWISVHPETQTYLGRPVQTGRQEWQESIGVGARSLLEQSASLGEKT